MSTSIIRYHTAIHYIMSITRDRFRPYWVSSGGCKKHSIINMLKNKFAIGCKQKKNAMQNNMIQQYLYHGAIRAYRCDLLSMSYVCVLECDPHDIGIAVSYCFALHFSFVCTQWQICFFSIFIIECFLHPPDETQ